jgi:hypothetical protein
VQAARARAETFLLRVVCASDVAHKLTHRVPVVIWRPEGVLGNQPAGRKDYKVENSLAGIVGLNCQHRENRRVWVVESD